METKDGRQARSERTRVAVAEAMLDCLEEGMLRPSAKQVAERAGVSSRAVFRHFDKMESLLEAASEIQIERVLRELPRIVTEGTLDQRVDSLVTHSARRNEITAPVRRSALLSEPYSKVIQERQAWLRSTIRRQIKVVFRQELNALPNTVKRERIAVLRSLLSFTYWDDLRRHEKMSNAAASRALSHAIRAVLQS